MRVRIFRGLLAFAPRAFRLEFGDALLETAATLDRERPASPLQSPAILADALITMFTIRRELRLERRGQPVPSRRRLMDGVRQDLTYALRGLRRDPGFTAFVVVALTLGIGANAAMFGIVDRLLLTGPPHITDPDRVVRLYLTTQPGGRAAFTTSSLGHVSYQLARTATSFSAVGTYAINDVVIGDGADAHPARAGYASASLFPLLGVRPHAGRFFSDAEDVPGDARRVAVLSFSLWQRAYGGRADVTDLSITVGTDRFAVVGVAPIGFTGPQFGTVDLWLPMNLKGPGTAPDWQTTWNAQWLQIVGRLAPGVTMARARDELTAIHQAGYTGDDPAAAHGRMTVAPIAANDAGVDPPELSVVRWLTGVAAIVLLIACANVANLILARGMRRARELALRAALGARARQLVRLLLIEALLLSAAGAIGAVGVASVLGSLARAEIFSWVGWEGSPVDGRLLIAASLCALVTTLLIGLAPAWRTVRTALADGLKRSARDGRGSRSRLRHALTFVQVALSALLLVGAGLFLRSLWHVRTLHLGVDADRVVTVEVSRPALSGIADSGARDAERTRRRLWMENALAGVRHLPGVTQAALAVGLPFGNRFSQQVRVPGVAKVPVLSTGGPSVSAVTADYFAVVGTRILRGRAFGADDHAGTEPVAIVSERMARTVWPGREAIGACLISGPDPAPCARIIGVAEDTHRGKLREPPVMHYYIPFGQEVGFGGTTLVARTDDAAAAGPAIRQELVRLDPTIRYVKVSTIQDAIEPQTKSWRVGATVFSGSGLLALLVAAVGLYSVMSYLLADRTHEIGVRVALGARRSDVARVILGSSVLVAITGAAAGIAAAVAASGLIEPLLFDESPRDPVILAGVCAVLTIVALAAGVVPVVRANRVDPLEALRVD